MVTVELHHHIFSSLRTVSVISLHLSPPANRFSPSKRARNSISALKCSSQEVLSSQKEEKTEEKSDRLGGARSLASLDGQGSHSFTLCIYPEFFSLKKSYRCCEFNMCFGFYQFKDQAQDVVENSMLVLFVRVFLSLTDS